jgi:hypothetical protein
MAGPSLTTPLAGVYPQGMRSHAGLVIVAAVLQLLGPFGVRPAFAKSARFEIQDRCPCPGPTIRTFWPSKDARLACVDAVIAKLLEEGWPEELLARDREHEVKSRCGDPRFQCDGTRAHRCPGRMVCEIVDANCDPAGATGMCVARSKHWRSCRNDPYPVCGCDGRTYRTDCRLRRAGVALAVAASCSTACGGSEHRTCGAAEFCWSATSCDGADAYGVCVELAALVGGPCERGDPVCGCDGVTYPDLCTLGAAGIPLKQYSRCGTD